MMLEKMTHQVNFDPLKGYQKSPQQRKQIASLEFNIYISNYFHEMYCIRIGIKLQY